MTPYLAVLKDCFREALASRILWLLTGHDHARFCSWALPPSRCSRSRPPDSSGTNSSNGPEFLKYPGVARESQKAKQLPAESGRGSPTRCATGCTTPAAKTSTIRSKILFAIRGELNGMLNNNDLYDRQGVDATNDDGRGETSAGTGHRRICPRRSDAGSIGC